MHRLALLFSLCSPAVALRMAPGAGLITEQANALMSPPIIPPQVKSALYAMQATIPEEPPESSRIDPNLLSTVDSCPRDWSLECPIGFVFIGEIYNSGAQASKSPGYRPGYCVADRSVYAGPCAADPIDFSRVTMVAKRRWSEHCGTAWPCLDCTMNFSVCPIGWSEVKKGVCLKPKDPEDLPGCFGTVDLRLYNAEARKSWSEDCVQPFPCLKGADGAVKRNVTGLMTQPMNNQWLR